MGTLGPRWGREVVETPIHPSRFWVPCPSRLCPPHALCLPVSSPPAPRPMALTPTPTPSASLSLLGSGPPLPQPVRPPGMQTLRTAQAALGKGCLASSFICVYLFTGELYPTEIRWVCGGRQESTCPKLGAPGAPGSHPLGLPRQVPFPVCVVP